MRRRAFITLLGGATAWPLVARAQQPALPVVGVLDSGSLDPRRHLVAAFRQGLKETGYLEGQNVAIEYRWAQDQYERLPALAVDLINHPVVLLVATGGTVSSIAAKAATSTIPIVFVNGGDPIKLGLVESIGKPGGNVTGVSVFTSTLLAKRLELLVELAPTASVIGVLVNPNSSNTESDIRDVLTAAASLGRQPFILNASTQGDLVSSFATLVKQRIGALLVVADAMFTNQRDKLVALAADHAVPTMYHFREFPEAGGLISYGVHFTDAYRQVGVYTGRILKGAKPADLPVLQPTRFELVINLKTAKALGIEIPPKILALADDVIE
jgi:putative ABC transport system substrate-binding protein